MVGEMPRERLFQGGDLAAQARACQLSQRRGITTAVDQRGHHRPSGHPEQIADHDRQLDLRVLQKLFGPVAFGAGCRDQIDSIPGQVPQHPDRRWRYEAGPDHLPLGDLAQPDRVQPVCLRPAGQMLDIAGVDQPHVETVRLQ
jgi:hypothetical protein